MTKVKGKKADKAYKVWYDKKVGGIGSVIVKALDPKNALQLAKRHVYTGRNFRNPRKVNFSEYSKPRDQGFQGSGRAN